MSDLNYVVIYHQNGMTSIHSISSWEQILREFSDTTNREVLIPGPYGNVAIMRRSDMESVYLVTEDEAEWNSRRHAAFEKLDQDNKGAWE